jgi:hypothetical protein
MARDVLKNINKEILAIGLLIISIGFQIMPLRVDIVETVAGAIIIVVGICVLNNAREKVDKKS